MPPITMPHSVVAHPPCADWSSLRAFARDDPERRSCAPRAVEQVREFGGVLEHPAHSSLWREMGLPRPSGLGFLGRSHSDAHGGWTLWVEQCAWGHRARKATWLYLVGVTPRRAMPRTGGTPTHVCSSLSKRRIARARSPQLPEMPKVDRHLTPVAFAEWLVGIARE